IGKTPGVQGYFTIIGGFAGGVNRAFVGVILKDWSERKNSVQQLVGMLFPQLFGIAGIQAFPYSPGALGFSQPVQFVVPHHDMAGIYLRGRGQQLVQLGALAKVEEGVGPRQINHFNRVPSFTLSASLIPPFAQGEALDSLDRLARRVLPPGSTTALAGDSREFRESGGALYFAFGVALLVVFIVLAAQFESLVHPFTVLLAVPLAVTGALGTLLVAALF